MARAHEIVTLCDRNGWKVIVGVEADKPEDISDVAELLRQAVSRGHGLTDQCNRQPAASADRRGRETRPREFEDGEVERR